MDQHLTTLRRDLITHFVEYVLKQPSSVSICSISAAEHSITLIPAPPNNDPKSSRIDNLSLILDFLSSHLFPVLPPSVSSTFPQSLFKPTTTSLLNTLLIPSLPSSFGLLPPFLDLAKHAVAFESKAVAQLLSNSTAELPIRTWVDGLSTHYEKQRRLELLGSCRIIILSPEDSKDRFQFELEVLSESAQVTVVPVQEEVGTDRADDRDSKDDAWGFEDEAEGNPSNVESVSEKVERNDFRDDAWGFDNEGTIEEKKPLVESWAASEPVEDTLSEDVDGGWEFDDDMPIDETELVAKSEPKPESPSYSPDMIGASHNSEPSLEDVWGWHDDTNVAEETEGDNTWDDDPWACTPEADIPTIDDSTASVALPAPKTATRLEKLVKKGKKPVNGHTSTLTSTLAPETLSYNSLPPSHPPPTHGSTQHTEKQTSVPSKRPPELKTNLIAKDSFAVPERAKRLVRTIENLIDECKQFQASSLFPLYPVTPSISTSQPGNILAQTPASLIDLYIAMYPVKFGEELSESVQKGMLFSNSCLYLAHEVGEIGKSLAGRGDFEGLKDRLEESAKNLKVMGESWYEQVVVRVSLVPRLFLLGSGRADALVV